MNDFTIVMAFVMGLTGSLHCVGMCGPIIWVMPFQHLSGVRKWLSILLYHMGRVTVYAMMAMVLYSFKSVFNPEIQQYISLVLGVGLLLVGALTFIPNNKILTKLPWTGLVQKNLAKFISSPNEGTLFITGMLNGLLPCGLVYMALSATMVATSTVNAMLLMYAFGIGTMPMLVLLTVIKNRMKFMQLTKVRSIVPIFMLFFGGLFILRGMNLGIPYLSPKVQVEATTIKAECCHK